MYRRDSSTQIVPPAIEINEESLENKPNLKYTYTGDEDVSQVGVNNLALLGRDIGVLVQELGDDSAERGGLGRGHGDVLSDWASQQGPKRLRYRLQTSLLSRQM